MAFASSKFGSFLSATEFSGKVDNAISEEFVIEPEEETTNNMSEFWMSWGNKHSDHIPKRMILSNDVRIMTYNVLNDKYLKHFDKDDNTNQGLGGCEFGATDRATINVAMINGWLEKKHIVLVQECSPSFFKRLTELIRDFWMTVEYSWTYVNSDASNWNLTLWKRDAYKLIAQNPLIAYEKGDVSYYTLQLVANPSIVFNLANVHVPWEQNNALLERCKELFFNDKYPTIVAGDFNASVRSGVEGDHINLYENDKIKFYLQDLSQPSAIPYSSVNNMSNAKTKSKMLDNLDYLMIITGK